MWDSPDAAWEKFNTVEETELFLSSNDGTGSENSDSMCSGNEDFTGSESDTASTFSTRIIRSDPNAYESAGGEDPKDGPVYTVAVGRRVGIYAEWKNAREQTYGYSGSSVKKFRCYEAAVAFLEDHQWRKIPQTTQTRSVYSTAKRGRVEIEDDQEDCKALWAAQKPRVDCNVSIQERELVAFCTGRVLWKADQQKYEAALACVFPNHVDWKVARKLEGPRLTSVRVKYLAALEALKRVKREDSSERLDLVIFLDSESVVKVMEKYEQVEQDAKHEEKVEDQDLVWLLLEEKGARRVTWRYTKAPTQQTAWTSCWLRVAEKSARTAARGGECNKQAARGEPKPMD